MILEPKFVSWGMPKFASWDMDPTSMNMEADAEAGVVRIFWHHGGPEDLPDMVEFKVADLPSVEAALLNARLWLERAIKQRDELKAAEEVGQDADEPSPECPCPECGHPAGHHHCTDAVGAWCAVGGGCHACGCKRVRVGSKVELLAVRDASLCDSLTHCFPAGSQRGALCHCEQTTL